ncbi:unnamed protein product [Rhodiola kirilowii]
MNKANLEKKPQMLEELPNQGYLYTITHSEAAAVGDGNSQPRTGGAS